ncbi:hypothetical protein OK016_17005 [Vibrio chagasii]|nr:hypothetical protein [Vibrio chagasii]
MMFARSGEFEGNKIVALHVAIRYLGGTVAVNSVDRVLKKPVVQRKWRCTRRRDE